MKRLDIKGFTSLTSKLVSDKFKIDDMDMLGESYMIQLSTSHYQYRMDIIREAIDTTYGSGYNRYQMWLYDSNRNHSYPMGVTTYDLSNTQIFTKFIENILGIADKAGFTGQSGDWRLRKYNY